MVTVIAMKAFLVAGLVGAFAVSPVTLGQSSVNDKVPVYDATQVAFDRYTVVKRLWVEGWRSAFWIPGHASEEAARQSLVSEAARLGADGVVNLQCLSRTDSLLRPAAYYCYGDAIKVKQQ
jgi:hypothetical protein